MKKFSKEAIKEVEKIYGKASAAEIEQAEILINNEGILLAYMVENENSED